MTPESTTKTPFRPQSSRRLPACILAAAAATLLIVSAAAPVASAQTPTLIVMRAVPAKAKKGENTGPLAPLTKADIAEVRIGGKPAPVTDFVPVLKGPHVLQLMVLFDSEQMLGSSPGQFDDIKNFFRDLPPNVEIGVGWLLQSKAVIVQPFTTDRDLVDKALIAKTRAEAGNLKNDNGNPYSCLRELASHWPGPDPSKLRAVLMFTDGIIRNNAQPSAGDQLNPDVEGTSKALQQAGILPYPFFYMDVVPADPGRNEGGQLEGQEYFSELTADTGGAALYEGMFAPGSFSPLLNRLYTTLASSAVVTVTAPGPPGKFARVDIKAGRDDIKIFGPDGVTSGNVLKGK